MTTCTYTILSCSKDSELVTENLDNDKESIQLRSEKYFDLLTVNGDCYSFSGFDHLTIYYQALDIMYSEDDQEFHDVILSNSRVVSNVHDKLINDEHAHPEDRNQPFLTDPINIAIVNAHFEFEVDNLLKTYMNNCDLLICDPNLSDDQKEWFKQIYKRCFWRVRGYLFEIYVKEGKYDDARALYAIETHEDAKVYIYSSYIMENDMSSARSYLNSISSESEQMADFITVQNINLDRLPYGPFYETSGRELNTVRAIALKSHPYAAYGKALYYALTGEVISSQIPDLGRSEINPRSFSSSNNDEALKVYPNPFSDVLNIEMSGYEHVNISVSDFLGRTKYTATSDQSNLSIPTDSWNQGMYLITIKSEGEIIFSDKVFLVH